MWLVALLFAVYCAPSLFFGAFALLAEGVNRLVGSLRAGPRIAALRARVNAQKAEQEKKRQEHKAKQKLIADRLAAEDAKLAKRAAARGPQPRHR